MWTQNLPTSSRLDNTEVPWSRTVWNCMLTQKLTHNSQNVNSEVNGNDNYSVPQGYRFVNSTIFPCVEEEEEAHTLI